MRVASYAVLVLMTGCFQPSPPEGAPCTSDGRCPSPLVCDLGHCVRMPRDARDQPDGQADASPDAPPNPRHGGLVQVTTIDTSASNATSNIAAGFVAVAAAAPGCTWTYAGACSLAVCNEGAGLTSISAGALSFMTGSTPAMLSPDAKGEYSPASVPTIAAGTPVSVMAEGGAVGAFATSTLVMPARLSIAAPASGASIDRTQELTVTWLPAPGEVYVNLMQTIVPDNPYPHGMLRTIRCFAPSATGSITVPASLLGQLASDTPAIVAIGGAATDSLEVGEYTVDFRLVAVDQVRSLSVQ